MTSQSVEGTWIRTGGYGRLRGEWVNQKTYKSPFADFFTDLPLNGQIWLFYAEKRIFLKKLGTLKVKNHPKQRKD